MTMPDHLELQELARTYGPFLDAMQQTLEAEFGPLRWTPRSEPELAHLHGGAQVLRVGAINAIGVPTAHLEPAAITRAVNLVLDRHGFATCPAMTGSNSGHLVCESTDSQRGHFTLLIKDTVNAWVDQPL